MKNLNNILDKINANKITEKEYTECFEDADLTEAITLFSNHDSALIECVRLCNNEEFTVIKVCKVDDDIYDYTEIDRDEVKEIAYYKLYTEREYKDFLISFIEHSKFIERV